MGLINDPVQALEDARSKATFTDKVKKRLESIIDSKLLEIENMSLTQSRRAVEDLEKLIKIYQLLSGEATERKESINHNQQTTQIRVLINELRDTQKALPSEDDVIDAAFDALDEEEKLSE